MTALQIDLVSDIACPWCAIGFARLQQALQQLPELDATVTWRAFELNPDPQLVPEPILPALCKKYGVSEAEMRANQQRLIGIANELGLDFSGMEQRLTCNTFNAHRLIKWAGTLGKQTELKLALFQAYFGQGVSVNEEAELLACVRGVGLPEEAARAVLQSTEFTEQVRQEQAFYQQAGVNSVPAFIINNRYLISGAQDPATLAQALSQIAAETTDA
ncbi:MAG TPA: DsbA family oxidoreductase [Rheinheimera sp.]|nr:DsbA family oxidoreductase [Rheinheimera sp.]